MNFTEYKEVLARGREVLAANRTALKNLLADGNMRALSVLSLASESIASFASTGSDLLSSLNDLPKSVLADIEAAFDDGSTEETPSAPPTKAKPGKKPTAKIAVSVSGDVREEIGKLLDRGMTDDQILEKLSDKNVKRGTIAAIKAHRTRKNNGHATKSASAAAKKPAKKKKPSLSDEDKQKLYADIRTVIARLGYNRPNKKLNVAAVKEVLASSEFGHKKVDGRMIVGVCNGDRLAKKRKKGGK